MTSSERVGPAAVRKAGTVGTWDVEADVVVVGYGCAGACAAIAAREAGAQVLLIERASGGGGTSANSGGLIYMGGGTPVQQAAGFDDTPEEMFKFLMAALGPDPDEAKIRMFCDESVAHFHWLEAHGVPFKRTFYDEPGMEAPTDDCLVYSGGEDGHPFNRIAKPAPRAHKPRHPGAGGGFLMQKLVAATERSGTRFEFDARCERLVVDDRDRNRVVGVAIRQNGNERLIRARRGVVLAAGGFASNREMVLRHTPLLARCAALNATEGDDGSGIRMAMGAGADIIRMHTLEVAYPLVPSRLLRGILVNRYGQRFINEDTYFGRLAQEALLRHDGEMLLIVDTAIYEPTIFGMQAAFVEETVADLERAIGLPAESLQDTVAYYNRFAAQGADPLFHKRPSFLQPLTEPPFAALDCRTGSQNTNVGAVFSALTLGGLHTLPSGEVLDPDANIIPGLYAAGRTTSGVAGGGYCTGISLGDGTFFGRKAGERAATANAG
ncbi:MAG: FAD-dependent oxidoreductase [Candidatus Binatia bacterium]